MVLVVRNALSLASAISKQFCGLTRIKYFQLAGACSQSSSPVQIWLLLLEPAVLFVRVDSIATQVSQHLFSSTTTLLAALASLIHPSPLYSPLPASSTRPKLHPFRLGKRDSSKRCREINVLSIDWKCTTSSLTEADRLCEWSLERCEKRERGVSTRSFELAC